MEYLIWSRKQEGNACVVEGPEGVDRSWELNEGVPLATTFPDDASFRMSASRKKDIGLTDNVNNLSSLVIVSAALKTFLEARAPSRVEYLPVAIVNHKGRIASRDYFILNPVGPEDCLDVDKSGCTYNSIVPTDIDWVDQLVLNPAKVDPRLGIFRIKNMGHVILVRRDLADAVVQAGFKGVLFLELAEYEK